MPVYSNFKDLEEAICKKVSNSLNSDVAKAIKVEESKEIKNTVYDVYTPSFYERRKNNGGLSDVNNMHHEVFDGILKITNETPVNPIRKAEGSFYDRAFDYELDKLVEYGNTGLYPMPERPFTKNTIIKLNQNKKHVKVLKKSLKNQGLDVI